MAGFKTDAGGEAVKLADCFGLQDVRRQFSCKIHTGSEAVKSVDSDRLQDVRRQCSYPA